jgi:hypothetical protein
MQYSFAESIAQLAEQFIVGQTMGSVANRSRSRGFCHKVQIGSGTHPDLYPMGTRGCLFNSEVIRNHEFSLTVLRFRMCGAVPPLPLTTSQNSTSLSIFALLCI